MAAAEYDVGALADFSDGELHLAEAGDNTVLIHHADGGLYAVDAVCPHAGAPLQQGVRHGDRIICPWHKATFCLRTGALLEPPAVDALRAHKVRSVDGRVLISIDDDAAAQTFNSPDSRRFVIVGSGAAGAAAAQTLREIGFGGEIVMIDRVNRVPYDRTLLSKYKLSGATGGEKSPLQTQTFYETHGIDRRTGDVVRVEADARRIVCSDGSALTYDALLLATGSAPTRPPIPGVDLGGVYLLRSLNDAEQILARAERSRRAVILGASFIGMEVAASLRERGLDITVVGQETAPFARQLGEQIGSVFVDLHKRHGVAFRLGHKVSELRGDVGVTHVVLDNGEHLPADLVIIGFGVKPETDFASGLRRAADGGIVVDSQLSAAPGVFAAGDIAQFPMGGDGAPIRVEHWRVALQQGRMVARNMFGAAAQYDSVPVFWTIQYLKRLDYIGHAEEWDETVIHGDLTKPQFLVYYVRAGEVVAAAGFDRDQDTAALIELFSIRRHWTAADLGDSPVQVLQSLQGASRGSNPFR